MDRSESRYNEKKDGSRGQEQKLGKLDYMEEEVSEKGIVCGQGCSRVNWSAIAIDQSKLQLTLE